MIQAALVLLAGIFCAAVLTAAVLCRDGHRESADVAIDPCPASHLLSKPKPRRGGAVGPRLRWSEGDRAAGAL